MLVGVGVGTRRCHSHGCRPGAHAAPSSADCIVWLQVASAAAEVQSREAELRRREEELRVAQADLHTRSQLLQARALQSAIVW